MTAVDSSLALRGELCEDTIQVLQEALTTWSGTSVVLDLTEVTIFSAAAMREVVRTRARGIVVHLINPSPLTARVLDAAGFEYTTR